MQKLTADEQSTMYEIARNDFEIFFTLVSEVIDPNLSIFELHSEIIANLEEWRRQKKLGVVISTPPQVGKSTLAAVTYILWLASREREDVAIITYSQTLSKKHLEKIRDIVKSPIYKAIFPEIGIKKSKDNKEELGLTRNKKNYSTFMALGRDSGISGNPFSLVIMDDLVKNFQEAVSPVVQEAVATAISTIIQRLKNNTRLISIGTRYYENDATGVFHQEAEKNPDMWVRISFAAIPSSDLVSIRTGEVWKKAGEAICPEITTLDRLLFAKSQISKNQWYAAYQQTPLRAASFFEPHWFKTISMQDVMRKKVIAFLTIDPAFSIKNNADDTGFCITFVDEQGFFYVMAWGEKMGSDRLMEKIFDLHTQFNFRRIGVERIAASQAIEPFLNAEARKRNHPIPIEYLSHGNSAKEQRILGSLPGVYGSGTVYHIENRCTQLEDQILNYPNPKYNDDVLDAMAYMVIMLTDQRGFGAGFTEASTMLDPKYVPTHGVSRTNTEWREMQSARKREWLESMNEAEYEFDSETVMY